MTTKVKSRNSGRSSKATGRRRTARTGEPLDWKSAFAKSADMLEFEARTLIRDHPAVVSGGAIGFGVASSILLKGSSHRKTRSPARIAGSTSLSGELTPTLNRIQERLEHATFEDFGSVKNQVFEILREQFEARPIPTIGTFIAVGYGLAELDRDQLLKVFVRAARLFVGKSLDSAGGRPKTKSVAVPNLNEEEGDRYYEYDQGQPH